MKTVIYLDLLLLVNFVAAAILLCAAAAVTGSTCRGLRLLSGSALAAAASLILLAPELPFWVQLAYQAASGAWIVRAAFGRQPVRAFLRTAVWYFLWNLLACGATAWLSLRGYRFVQTNNLACYYAVSPLLLLLCMAGVYAVLRVSFFCFGRVRPPDVYHWELLPQVSGWTEPTGACLDTGLTLDDPFGDRAVILIAYPSVQRVVPPAWRCYLDAVFSAQDSPGCTVPPAALHVRFLECSTVAGTALLPAIPAEYAELCRAHERHTLERVLLVFTEEKPADERCPALFGLSCWERMKAEKEYLYR